MMEESQEILLNSLKRFGIEIPSEISSVGEINPSSLFSICVQSLGRLPLLSGDETPLAPALLPDSVVDRVRICTHVASSLKNLGFVGHISFHKLLYPSEEDLYKLVRFLVIKLSEATEIAESHYIQQNDVQQQEDQRRQLQEDGVVLLDSLHVSNPVAEGRHQKLNDVLETESVFCEMRNREQEFAKLTAELKKQPKAANRKSYVDSITKITKNSRKQDTDIERILKETRELQLESNSVEECLHRSYTVVDEMVFREAKKDTVSRIAYRLLTNIHNSFEEIREKIMEMDRTKREVDDIELKLATLASRNLDLQKLQADISALTTENKSLHNRLL